MIQKEIEIQIGQIKEKMQQLLAEKKMLQKENAQLKNNLQEKEKENGVQQERAARLQTQVQALLLLNGEKTDPEKKELRKTIDQHLAVIEQTIALLNE